MNRLRQTSQRNVHQCPSDIRSADDPFFFILKFCIRSCEQMESFLDLVLFFRGDVVLFREL
jgi:hypothetical protein